MILLKISLSSFAEENLHFENLPHQVSEILPSKNQTPCSIESAIQQILSRNTSIQTQEFIQDSIYYKNIPAKLFFLPKIDIEGRSTQGSASALIALQQEITVNARMNFFRWGADRMGSLSATHEQLAQKAKVQATLLQKEEEAVEVLIAQIQRKKEVEINSSIVNHQTELCNIAEERYQKGYLPLQEVEKMMIDLSNAKAALIDAQMNETEAEFRLESLLGHSQIQIEWPWITSLKKIKTSLLFQEDQIFSKRPDWIEIQNTIQSIDYKIKQNWRLLLPSLDLRFSYGYYNGYFGSAAGWMGSLSVSVPLFDQLVRYSQAKEQSSLHSASEVQLEQIQRNATAEWKIAEKNLRMAFDSAILREKTLVLSRKLYQDHFRRFQAGRITSNDLTLDRNRMYQAELFAAQGWGALHTTFSKLCHALGYQVAFCLKSLE